ncbi:hypothetical protein F5Y05DRAFT_411283 [Hypoxylon sp. FL0543]|nr:hypothetical protein F5Y05DRAFT_411283 [Hypoxylon sp. FL0543]
MGCVEYLSVSGDAKRQKPRKRNGAGEAVFDVRYSIKQNGPVYRTMFPLSDTVTEAQKDEIIRCYAEMLENAFRDGWESLWKASSVNGTPLGFCGWTIIERNWKQVEANDGQADEQPSEEKQAKKRCTPEVIDVDSWINLSRAKREERDRALKDLDNICRLTFMAGGS